MGRLINLLAAAAVAAGGVSMPAMAAETGQDLTYNGDSVLAETAKGSPYWVIQGQCAGFFGATSNYYSQQGKTAEADAAKAQGVRFFRDAVDRLVSDRGVTREVAVASVARTVDTGRSEGLQAIKAGASQSTSAWNITRSVCLDVAEAYRSARYQ